MASAPPHSLLSSAPSKLSRTLPTPGLSDPPYYRAERALEAASVCKCALPRVNRAGSLRPLGPGVGVGRAGLGGAELDSESGVAKVIGQSLGSVSFRFAPFFYLRQATAQCPRQ